MRRSEFEIKDSEVIYDVLKSGRWGDLSLINSDGYPVIKPMNYLYLNNQIYLHGANEGEKFDSLNSKACFMVVDELSFIPGNWLTPNGTPANPTCFFRSVMLKATPKLIIDPNEKSSILNEFSRTYQQDGNYKLMTPENKGLPRVLLFSLDMNQVTCKCKLGQNLGPTVRQQIYEKLLSRKDQFDQKTANLMAAYKIIQL